MGALTPIIFQGAIPVFADVDPKTLNVTAETIEKVLSEKTKAIIVTHLFGNPCEMDAIMKLADERKFPSSKTQRNLSWQNATANTSAQSARSARFLFSKANK